MENGNDFEKDAAVYFERLHQVFAKLDLLTVEKQNEQLGLSAIAINYSSELKFAYGRVRVSVSVRYRPAICIASVCRGAAAVPTTAVPTTAIPTTTVPTTASKPHRTQL